MSYLLVIDDDPELLLLLDAHYSVRGRKVVTANSAQVAMSALAKKRPMAILLDLPPSDGAQFIAQLRADKKGKDVPVVLIGSADSERAAQKFPSDCFVRSLAKPIDFERLDSLLEEMISTRRRTR